MNNRPRMIIYSETSSSESDVLIVQEVEVTNKDFAAMPAQTNYIFIIGKASIQINKRDAEILGRLLTT